MDLLLWLDPPSDAENRQTNKTARGISGDGQEQMNKAGVEVLLGGYRCPAFLIHPLVRLHLFAYLVASAWRGDLGGTEVGTELARRCGCDEREPNTIDL